MASDIGSPSAEDALALLHDAFSGHANGMAQVYVAHRGEHLANLVVGEPGPTPLDVEDRIPLFSASKPFLAVAIARLWEDGDLDVEAPVSHYLPAFAGERRDRVKVWHLLTHTSGLAGPTPPGDRWADWEASKELAIKWDVQAGWTPGFRARYSPDGGWVLLAMVLEACTGRPYDVSLDDLVWRPLGLTRTSFADEDRLGVWQWEDEHSGYVHRHERLIGRGSPGSGALSCAGDLGRFYASLLPSGRAGVLSAPTVSAMTSHQRVRVEEEYSHTFAGYGLGFELDFMTRHDSRVSYRSFGHSGTENVRIWADPEHDLVAGYVATVLPGTSELHYERLRRLAEFAYGLAGIRTPERGQMRHYGRSAGATDRSGQSLRSIVVGLIAAYLGIGEAEIGDDTRLLDDLMLDSLAIPEIVTLVSETVGLEASFDDSALLDEDLTLRTFVLGLVFRGDVSEFDV